MNSFNLLQSQEVEEFNRDPKSERMYHELEARLSTMRFLGAVFNMYVPIMADTIVNITGGGTTQPTAEYGSSPSPSLPPLPPSEPRGPEGFESDQENPIR